MTTPTKRPRAERGLRLKCNDGVWLDGDKLKPPPIMLVAGTGRCLRCWGDGELLDEILELPGEELPDVDNLNAQIPKKEWRTGLNGEPDPPWKYNFIVWLAAPETASIYTFMNSTFGAMLAVTRLEERLQCARALHGADVVAEVKLDSRPMTIKRLGNAVKQRPEFTVLEFRHVSGGGAGLLGGGGTGAKLIEHKPEPAPATPEKTADTLEERLRNQAATGEGFKAGIVEQGLGETKKKPTVGKKVKPISVAEEIDDGLPGDLAPPTDNIMGAG